MKYKHPNRTQAAILVAAFVACSFLLGIYVGAENPREVDRVTEVTDKFPPLEISQELSNDGEADFEAFWKAWNILKEEHIEAEDISPDEKVWAAIQGLASSYGDPYTVFFPPEEAEEFQLEISGNFEGVGMEVGMKNEIITVIAPLKGTPADKAGIQPGDTIIEIDEESTIGMTLDEAVDRIRGPEGTEVVLTVLREGREEAFDIAITRDSIQIPTIDARDEGEAFVISLYNFSANSSDLFRDALSEFAESGEDDLVIDLRGNPGGYLEAAVEMASYFLPSGKVVVREVGPGGEELSVHRSYGYNIFRDANIDIAVLVDGGSASASEILAGALSEHDVATLVGEGTFGKGSVQELITVTPETALKVTVAEWLTPEGNSISENGLTPEVEVSDENFEDTVDEELNRAIEIVSEN